MNRSIKIHIIHLGKPTWNDWYRGFTPDCSGKWGNLELCEDFDEADLYIAFRSARTVNPLIKKCPPRTVINLQREPKGAIPPASRFGRETLASQWVTQTNIPGVWWIKKTYSELMDNPFPRKTKLLSYVITGHYGRPRQRDRIDFTKKFAKKYPGKLDMYGRNTGGFDLSSIPGYKGEIEDKWDGVAPYRYAFAFENICEPNYFTEKFNDTVLTGCMPIYWGCTNMSDFFPKGSYVEVDTSKPDAVDRAMEIVQSDYRERNIDALRKAKHLILNKYQFWPTLERLINKLIGKGEISFE